MTTDQHVLDAPCARCGIPKIEHHVCSSCVCCTCPPECDEWQEPRKEIATASARACIEVVASFDAWCALPDPSDCASNTLDEGEAFERLCHAIDALRIPENAG